MTTKSTHGGARPGSGRRRKADDEKAKPYNLRLSKDAREILDKIKPGQRSAFVNRAIVAQNQNENGAEAHCLDNA